MGISRIMKTKEDKEIETIDKLSGVIIVMFFLVCFLMGVCIGYLMYALVFRV